MANVMEIILTAIKRHMKAVIGIYQTIQSQSPIEQRTCMGQTVSPYRTCNGRHACRRMEKCYNCYNRKFLPYMIATYIFVHILQKIRISIKIC